MEILGINRIESETYNYNITLLSSVLPWLQDTSAQSVWTRWGITYRDVLILDSFNRPVARDNLTTHDLGVQSNYDALRKALLAIATPADTDKDGLPDDWEIFWFNGLTATPTGDDDKDGFDNFTEFAFGSNPMDATSVPKVHALIARPAGKQALAATFHRFAGGAVDFIVETSPDLVTWSANPTQIFRNGGLRNSADGLGGADVRYQQTSTSGALGAGFIRVRPVSRLTGP